MDMHICQKTEQMLFCLFSKFSPSNWTLCPIHLQEEEGRKEGRKVGRKETVYYKGKNLNGNKRTAFPPENKNARKDFFLCVSLQIKHKGRA